ncbi:MAG: hypothetical protein QW199_03115 [Candidatus Pacearchaeota archaeon]
MKKAQIAFFVLISLIVVVAGVVGWLAYESLKEKEKIEIINATYAKEFVDSCFKAVSEMALVEIGISGGYYRDPPNYGILFYTQIIPLYLYNKKKDVPQIEDVEEAIQDYIVLNLKYCLAQLKSSNVNINYEQMKVDPKLDKQTTIILYLPVTVEENNKAITFSDFEFNAPISIQKFLDTANQLVDWQINYDGICLDCIENLAFQKKLKIKALQQVFDPTNSSLQLYQIYDESYKIENQSYLWVFAAEF